MKTALLFIALLACVCSIAAQINVTNVIKVGFIYGNYPTDLSWTYAQDLGRAFLEFQDPSVKTRYRVGTFSCDKDYFTYVDQFAAEGSKLIVLTSAAYQGCGPDSAKKYPNIFFMCMGCERPKDAPANYGAVFSRIHEARYVQGVLAGLVSKTKKIGFIGSLDFGGDRLDPNTILLGARTTCPDCQILRYRIGNFFDPVLAAEAGRRLIAAGCDAILHQHDAFDWFPIAVQANISVFGHDVDQISLAPNNMITSSYYIWGPFLSLFVNAARNNTIPQDTIFFGFRERGVGVTAFTNVPDSYAQLGYQAVQLMFEKEFVNGYSYLFCNNSDWDKLRVGTNYSSCLSVFEIISMFEYVPGITDLGAVPVPQRPLKYVKWGSAKSVVLLVLTGICIAITLIFLIVTFLFMNTTVVKMSHPAFMLVTFLGMLLGLGMVFTYPGQIKDKSCVARTWTGGLGFALIFAPMIAKNYRLARIMSNTALISTVIPTFELIGVAGGLIGVEILILIIWTVISDTRLHAAKHQKGNYDILVCRSKKEWPMIGIQLAYVIIVLLAGFILSYLNRKIARRVLFKEAQWINYTFYSSSVWFLLWALATGLLWNNYNAAFVISILAILLLVMFVLMLVVGPKMYILLWVKGGRESGSVTGSHSSDFSTDFKPDQDFNNAAL